MSKFTPGPWRIVKCGCRHPVCKMWFLDHAMSDGRLQEANARLIAAAPEMAELLDDACAALEMGEAETRSYVALQIRALLARIDQ